MTQCPSLSFFSEGVSSMSHLLDKPLLRAAVWSISCVTCLGNSLVLWGRFTAKDENRVLSIIIRNLAGNCAIVFLAGYLEFLGERKSSCTIQKITRHPENLKE